MTLYPIYPYQIYQQKLQLHKSYRSVLGAPTAFWLLTGGFLADSTEPNLKQLSKLPFSPFRHLFGVVLCVQHGIY